MRALPVLLLIVLAAVSYIEFFTTGPFAQDVPAIYSKIARPCVRWERLPPPDESKCVCPKGVGGSDGESER